MWLNQIIIFYILRTYSKEPIALCSGAFSLTAVKLDILKNIRYIFEKKSPKENLGPGNSTLCFYNRINSKYISVFCKSLSVRGKPKSDSSLFLRNHIEAILKVMCSSVKEKISSYSQRFHEDNSCFTVEAVGMHEWGKYYI